MGHTARRTVSPWPPTPLFRSPPRLPRRKLQSVAISLSSNRKRNRIHRQIPQSRMNTTIFRLFHLKSLQFPGVRVDNQVQNPEHTRPVIGDQRLIFSVYHLRARLLNHLHTSTNSYWNFQYSPRLWRAHGICHVRPRTRLYPRASEPPLVVSPVCASVLHAVFNVCAS